MPRKIILDCDPGHDDAIAMLLAHGNPDVDLVAVTTVVGNQTLEKVTRNALSVARIANITGTPFAAGCPRPLVRDVETAPDIHGESGIDGPVMPEPTLALDERHAVDLIIDTVMAHEPGEITIVPTAGLTNIALAARKEPRIVERPEDCHTQVAVDLIIDTVMAHEPGEITIVPTAGLTNIALAARKEPRIVERVREVVLMGGGYHTGNWSPVAEFNIKIDPEAAHIVFNESWPVTMVGLDLTHQALATPEVVERIAKVGTGPAVFVTELLDFFGTMYLEAQGFDAPPVHDPCAVAYVIDPDVMTVRKAPVDIELTGTLTLGMTVTDFRAPAPEDCHTQVAVDLDHQRFWDLVVDALERIGDVRA
ncbi:nucleoside hydrolase [Streptomyces flavofungini]|uniref:nucleoside hydrolase n=1 Tax=Streptomyces flavofungini TaxID=68200 RepID=UPI0034DEA320